MDSITLTLGLTILAIALVVLSRRRPPNTINLRIDSLNTHVASLLQANREQVDSIRSLVGRIETLAERTDKLERAGGGYWKTAQGALIHIRDMHSDHIRNCLKGFAKGDTKRKMIDELKLRHVRAQYETRDLGDEITGLGGDFVASAAKPYRPFRSNYRS